MKVWLTGAGGQLGRQLAKSAPPGVTLLPTDSRILDITDTAAIEVFFTHEAPDIVINAAAYTAVDHAEDDAARAFAVNEAAVAAMGRLTGVAGKKLIHISTDYVFDGAARAPYRPDDATNPLGVYSQSKRAGEIAALAHDPRALIFRTAWVYGPVGSNFLLTMLRLMRERESLGVVNDQHGTPTSTATLAALIWQAAFTDKNGIYHATDGGQTSWHGFATAIQEEALKLGLLDREIPIRAIATSDYPTRTRRPAYSVLDCEATVRDFGFIQVPWRDQLRAVLKEF